MPTNDAVTSAGAVVIGGDGQPREVMLSRRDPTFGPWLREKRCAVGLTLQVASTATGLTIGRLQKMETGGRVRLRAPSEVNALADLLGVEREAFWRRAGCRICWRREGTQIMASIDSSDRGHVADPVAGDVTAPSADSVYARGYQSGWNAAVAALLAAAKTIADSAELNDNHIVDDDHDTPPSGTSGRRHRPET